MAFTPTVLLLFIDITALKEYNYTYEGGRLIRSAEHNVTFDEQYNVILRDYVGTIDYTYAKDGRLVKKNVYVYGASVQYFTEYPENSNPVVKVKYNNQSIESHSKTDSFGRKEFEELQAGTGFVSRQFMYERGKATEEHKQNGKLKSSPTTSLVKQIIFHDDRTLSYEYDKEERITKVTDSLEGVTEYTYDAQGQLLTEVRNGVTVNSMTYDNYGNILSKNGVIYEYDSVWKDKLIKVGTGENSTITYDAQGNPTNYLGHTLTWEKGRQLKSLGNNTYTYNANGIRTSKTVNGVKHTFMLEGSKITKEAWGENTLLPLYNNKNSICGIIYNRVMYLFLKNLQGDIIAITNQNGETIARYAYDAWGKCTVIQDSSNCLIATINPFRYRGYYYDQEIGMYYLQSRYYDPSVGRFINADAPNFVAVSGGNLFSYCGNAPVKRRDLFGFCFIPAVGEALEAFISALAERITKAASLLEKHILKQKTDELAICSNRELNIDEAKHNAKLVYNYLELAGWSHHAICAVLGNMYVESSINPGRYQDGVGPGYGLVQWDPGTKYTNWATKNGYSNESMIGQLEYLLFSMKPGVGEWFANRTVSGYYMNYLSFTVSVDSIEYLTQVFFYSYERASIKHMDRRLASAKYWDQYFSGSVK